MTLWLYNGYFLVIFGLLHVKLYEVLLNTDFCSHWKMLQLLNSYEIVKITEAKQYYILSTMD